MRASFMDAVLIFWPGADEEDVLFIMTINILVGNVDELSVLVLLSVANGALFVLSRDQLLARSMRLSEWHSCYFRSFLALIWRSYSRCFEMHWYASRRSFVDGYLSRASISMGLDGTNIWARHVGIAVYGRACGAWSRIGRFDAFRPKGCGFVFATLTAT